MAHAVRRLAHTSISLVEVVIMTEPNLPKKPVAPNTQATTNPTPNAPKPNAPVGHIPTTPPADSSLQSKRDKRPQQNK